MNQNKITAYSIPTDYPNAHGVSLDHVFVVSDAPNNWGCFGRGAECIPQAKQIAQVDGYAKWADLLCGPDNTGLTNYVSGTCHNVANRLLVLAGKDVSKSAGDPLVILMYGKYGFKIDQYIERIKTTANQINQMEPGTLAQAEIDFIISQINGDASGEMEILEDDFKDLLAAHNEKLTDDQKARLLTIYTSFHDQRLIIWGAEPEPPGCDSDWQKRYALRLLPSLTQCLNDIATVLGGPEQFKAIFNFTPQQAIPQLLGL